MSTVTGTRPRFYFHQPKARRAAIAYRSCIICGVDDLDGMTRHNHAVHEVFALQTWGMNSVGFGVRHLVRSWSDGTAELPSNADFITLTSSWARA